MDARPVTVDELMDFPELTRLALATRVACKLGGRPVTVRFRQPAAAGFYGMTYSTDGGGMLVDVWYERAGSMWGEVLLHEVAHVKLGHVGGAPTGNHERAPGSLEWTQRELKEARNSPMEDQARRLGLTWLRLGWAQSKRFVMTGLPNDCWPLLGLLVDEGAE